MSKPLAMNPQVNNTTVAWDIYYLDKRDGRLRKMTRELPANMSRQGLHDYIGRMGHTIDKAISDEIIYTY